MPKIKCTLCLMIEKDYLSKLPKKTTYPSVCNEYLYCKVNATRTTYQSEVIPNINTSTAKIY